jgi:hypothetical protein
LQPPCLGREPKARVATYKRNKEVSKNVYKDKLNLATKIHLHRKKEKVNAARTN